MQIRDRYTKETIEYRPGIDTWLPADGETTIGDWNIVWTFDNFSYYNSKTKELTQSPPCKEVLFTKIQGPYLVQKAIYYFFGDDKNE